jgi:hypothetical protein
VQFIEPTTEREDDALVDSVRRSQGRVVLGTTETNQRGETAVLGGDDVLRSVGARAAHTALHPSDDGAIRRFPTR